MFHQYYVSRLNSNVKLPKHCMNSYCNPLFYEKVYSYTTSKLQRCRPLNLRGDETAINAPAAVGNIAHGMLECVFKWCLFFYAGPTVI